MNQRQKNKKSVAFLFLSIIVLSCSLFVNPSAELSENGDGNFDWYSDGIIFSDLLYNKYFEPNAPLLKSLTPDDLIRIYGGEYADYINSVKNAYCSQNRIYKESDFGTYKSNIVIQRYFFRFLDSALDVEDKLKADIFLCF